MPDQFPKFCANCGRVYTPDQWRQLRSRGLGTGLSDAEPLSYRDCPCGNTLAVIVDPDTDWARGELMAALDGPGEHLKDNRGETDL